LCGFKLVPIITACIDDFGLTNRTLGCIGDGILEEGLSRCMPCACTIIKKIDQKLGSLCCKRSGCGKSGNDNKLSVLGLSVHDPKFAGAIEAYGTVCSKTCEGADDAFCHYCLYENSDFQEMSKKSCIFCGIKLIPAIVNCIKDLGVSKETLTCIKDVAIEEGLNSCLPCVCKIISKINNKLGELCCQVSGCGESGDDDKLSVLGLSVHDPVYASAIEAYGTVCSKPCDTPIDAICHYCISDNVPDFPELSKTPCLVCGFKLVPAVTECIFNFGVSKETLICVRDAALEDGLDSCLPCVCTIVSKINNKLGKLCCQLSGCDKDPEDGNFYGLGLSESGGTDIKKLVHGLFVNLCDKDGNGGLNFADVEKCSKTLKVKGVATLTPTKEVFDNVSGDDGFLTNTDINSTTKGCCICVTPLGPCFGCC